LAQAVLAQVRGQNPRRPLRPCAPSILGAERMPRPAGVRRTWGLALLLAVIALVLVLREPGYAAFVPTPCNRGPSVQAETSSAGAADAGAAAMSEAGAEEPLVASMGAPLQRRGLAAAALALMVLVPGGRAAWAGLGRPLNEFNAKNDEKNLEGYDFDGLSSKLDASMSNRYDKVKPVCKDSQQGGSAKSDTVLTRVVCDRADRLAEKKSGSAKK